MILASGYRRETVLGADRKWLHEARAAAAGPRCGWLRRELATESTDSALNSLLALDRGCSPSPARQLRNHFYDFDGAFALARYSSSTCRRIATSDSNVAGSSGPNEKRKNDAYGDR